MPHRVEDVHCTIMLKVICIETLGMCINMGFMQNVAIYCMHVTLTPNDKTKVFCTQQYPKLNGSHIIVMYMHHSCIS